MYRHHHKKRHEVQAYWRVIRNKDGSVKKRIRVDAYKRGKTKLPSKEVG